VLGKKFLIDGGQATDRGWLPRARRGNATVARAVIGRDDGCPLTAPERLRPVAARPSDDEPAPMNERTSGPYRAWRVSSR
jgi:hypothetical protein